MKKFASIVVLMAAATVPALAFADTTAVPEAQAAAAVTPTAGKTLYAADGHRIAPIYRVKSDGNPQVIVDGRLVTVPAATLSDVGGKITTSLSKKELVAAK